MTDITHPTQLLAACLCYTKQKGKENMKNSLVLLLDVAPEPSLGEMLAPLSFIPLTLIVICLIFGTIWLIKHIHSKNIANEIKKIQENNSTPENKPEE